MKLLWLSVLGFLCLPAAAAASDESNQCEQGQFLGLWYVHGIASNCEWMVGFLVKEIMTSNITSQDEGSITITTSFMTEYGPMEMAMTYMKQSNGLYLHKGEWGDKFIEEKNKTDCETYAITCISDVEKINGILCKFVSLYYREMSVPYSLQQSFVDFAMEMQIDRKQIFLLARKDAAMESA